MHKHVRDYLCTRFYILRALKEIEDAIKSLGIDKTRINIDGLMGQALKEQAKIEADQLRGMFSNYPEEEEL